MAFIVALTLAAPALAQDAISDVITDQFRDFAADDFAGAFDHASPGIQGIFGSVDRFGTMVRQGYPMVWRYQSFRLTERREIAGALWQRVEVIDAEGRLHALDYKMEQGAAGWKIDGVQLLPPPVPNV
jgi:hypothetical protein